MTAIEGFSWQLALLAPLIGFIGMYSGGFWSVGCSWLIVPSMLFFFGCTPMQAAGVGLLQMAPAIVGTVVREAPEIGWGRGGIGRMIVLPAAFGALATSFCGRPINVFFNNLFGAKALLVGFGGFMLFIGYKTLFGRGRDGRDLSPVVLSGRSSLFAFLGGLGAGVFSSVLGVGGAMVFRPLLANGFRLPESDVARSLRFLLLTTTVVGGGTYLFSQDGIDLKILVLAGLIALGGAAGFPLGARAHKVVVESGRSSGARRSFAIICGIVFVNVCLSLAGLREASRFAMLAVAVLLLIFLKIFVWYSRRHPLA